MRGGCLGRPVFYAQQGIATTKAKMLAAILFVGGIVIGAGSSEIIHAQAPPLRPGK